MPGKNKIKLRICGGDYYLTTDDDPAYVKDIGDDVEDKIIKLTRENPRLSTLSASVFACLEYAGALASLEHNTDNLRGQIKGYLEDAQKYKIEAEVMKSQVQALQSEITELKQRLGYN